MDAPRYESTRRLRRAVAGSLAPYRGAYTVLEGLAVLGFHSGVFALVAGGAWTLARFSPAAGLFTYPFVLFLLGSRMRAFGNILHETAHRSFFRSARANRLLGCLLALLDLQDFDAYVRDHRSHHSHLGVAGRDRDFAVRARFGFDVRGPSPFAQHILRPLTLFHLSAYLDPRVWVRGESGPWRTLRLAWAVGLACTLALFPAPTVLLVLFPYITSYQVLRYWSDALDHAGALGDPDAFLRTRNHAFRSRLANLVVFPRNDAWHLVHHLFPSLPARAFPALHSEVLMRQEIYARR